MDFSGDFVDKMKKCHFLSGHRRWDLDRKKHYYQLVVFKKKI